ncbi:MAG: hypothetical protein AAF682_28850 [Planctomycetota bacterium]
MRGLLLLSWRRLLFDRVRSAILVLCLAVPIFLPLATARLVSGYEAELVQRGAETPLVLGARGSRFDLVLSALYFRESDVEPVPWSELDALQEAGEGVCIPLHARFTAQGYPVVGTSPEYFGLRRLAPAAGTLPLVLGDAVLGASVAAELGLVPGDSIFSDPRELYDITKPPALKMHVAGVLAPRGTADDEALFVDVKTAWILEGLTHGHAPADEIDASLVIGRSEGAVAFSGALIEVNEVTPDTLASFHHHASPDELPLSAVLVLPASDKAATLMKSRVNAAGDWQMVVPSAVIDDLLSFVFRIKALLDTFSLVLAASTLAMTALVLLLSMRIRAAEMRTLDRIGA